MENQPGRSRFDFFYIILTILTLLATLCVIGYSVLIFFEPYSALNPFPPATLLPLAQLPSATPTDVLHEMPSTWTPVPTATPTSPKAPTKTATLPPTPSPITVTASPTREPGTPVGGYLYKVRPGNPKVVQNLYHLDLGCDWMGVGGNVVDFSNSPETGLIIRLGGQLPGRETPNEMISLTGLAPSYGPSGYEFTLADRPSASSGMLWVQVFDQAGASLSEKVRFDTFDSCDQNLILIDFVQAR